jgi:hypothetical protein
MLVPIYKRTWSDNSEAHILLFCSFCAAHEAGLATLQVACEGFVISNSVIFEYKKPAKEAQVSACEPKLERSSSDNLLKFTLLQRLEAMDDRLQIKQDPDCSELVSDSLLNSVQSSVSPH